MWITPVTPAAHRFGERFTWLTSQWKLRADPAQFWVEINSLTATSGSIGRIRSLPFLPFFMWSN
ncbi:hypothetical protein, partial [Tabrizicola fusiformis]|uniref:hypothetical protein n=1 Tax=Tabrizicola sp. SY72 TaxID=2741673 RepID=UPI0019D50D7A